MKSLFTAVVISVAITTPAIGQIDQQLPISYADDNFNSTGTGLGQSFTPSLIGIDFASFLARADTSPVTVRADLYQGSGYAGLLLGSSLSQTFSNLTRQQIYFTFANTIPLTPGTSYTLRYTATDGAYRATNSRANEYLGGESYGGPGYVVAGDLVFSEGLMEVAAVPEPVSWTMLILGMGVVGYALRRRQLIDVSQAT